MQFPGSLCVCVCFLIADRQTHLSLSLKTFSLSLSLRSQKKMMDSTASYQPHRFFLYAEHPNR